MNDARARTSKKRDDRLYHSFLHSTALDIRTDRQADNRRADRITISSSAWIGRHADVQ